MDRKTRESKRTEEILSIVLPPKEFVLENG